MQQTSYLNDLEYIIESLDLETNGKLSFLGDPYNGYDYPDASEEVRLFNNLNNLLYSACYTRGSFAEQRDSISSTEDDSLLPALRRANVSLEHYDCGWKVEEVEQAGNIVVRKGGNKRHTFAGDFIREHFGQGPLQRGEVINIRVLPEYNGEQRDTDVFYFVFGETLLDNNNSALVRVYFNISPDGADALIDLVSNKLNHFNIPFQFKCLNRAALYTRCDSAVLYVDKRHFSIVGDLVSEGYNGLKIWLNPDVPMFTRQLAPGIGFAENPFASGESFGTSRCKIIAQAIVDAWKDKKTKEVWMDFILKNFHKNYLLPEALYLNPNSKYPYQFPEFEN